MIDRSALPLLGLAVTLALPAGAAADPTLQIEAVQSTSPRKVLSFLRTTSWWIEVEARADAAPLQRLEYWARELDGPQRRRAGSFDLPAETRELNGIVPIRFPINADAAERMRVRMRVHDAAGHASDWQDLNFPNDARLASERREPATAPPPTPAARERTTVEIVADDDTTLGAVRTELERAARLRGGRMIGEPRIAGTEDGKTRFAADVDLAPAAASAPAAPPTPAGAPARDHPTTIGEIFMPDAPLR